MKLLVTGNIGYITTEFIEEAFPECQILLLGETEQKSNRNKSLSVYPMPKTEEEFKDIFKTYEFEGVIYFSNYLTFHGTMEGEIETLRKLLHYYKGNLNSRLLYITGPDSLYEDTTGKTLMVRSAEEFCRQYGELHQIAVKILRVPYLYSGTYEEDYFFKLFSTVINKKQITFEEAPAQEMHFLALSDLGDLLYKIFDNWGEESSSSFFHRRTEVPCRSFLQDWKITASSVMRSIPWRMQIQEKNYDSDSAWSIPDPVTYCLLCAGLAGDKDTSAKGEKISDGTCDLRSFLGNSVRAAFAFANADQKRQ